MEQIINLITTDRTGIALRTLLSEYQLAHHVRTSLNVLNSQYTRLQNDIRNDTVSRDDMNRELNKINEATLEIITDLETHNQESRAGGVRYYVYYSETKLNMLYAQISNKQSNDFDKIYTIEAFLMQKNLVDEYPAFKKQFIHGTFKMNWGWLEEYSSDIVFFGTRNEHANLCLIGSKDSLLGAPKLKETSHAPDYYMFRFFNTIIEDEEFKIANNTPTTTENSINNKIPYFDRNYTFARFMKHVSNKDQELEFLAKVITVFSETRKKLIIATPIFVSYA